jgi:hypothetical protein
MQRILQDLNAAENERPQAGIEETIAAIDQFMSQSVEDWMNGEHRPNRETERAQERLLFADLLDYHRSFHCYSLKDRRHLMQKLLKWPVKAPDIACRCRER